MPHVSVIKLRSVTGPLIYSQESTQTQNFVSIPQTIDAKLKDLDYDTSYLAVRWTYQQTLNSKQAIKQPSFLVYYGFTRQSVTVVGLIASHLLHMLEEQWCSNDLYFKLSRKLDDFIDCVKSFETYRKLHSVLETEMMRD